MGSSIMSAIIGFLAQKMMMGQGIGIVLGGSGGGLGGMIGDILGR
jgi:hypothetical protein